MTVGERVDDGNRGGFGRARNLFVLEGADHEGACVAADDPRAVLERFAAPELEIGAVQEDGDAAEASHGRTERDARARRRLDEVEAYRFAGKHVRPAVGLGLELRRAPKQVCEIIGAQVRRSEKVFHWIIPRETESRAA